MLYIYHKKQLVKCQHEVVANDKESAIVAVQEMNRKGSLTRLLPSQFYIRAINVIATLLIHILGHT